MTDVESTPAPARVCRFVPGWAVIVLVATLASLAVNAGPGVSALVDYATHAHTAPVAAVAGPGVPCDTDAHCAALTARQDAAAGRVPAVAHGPAGAVSCPDGWEVDGTGVFDSHCVPSTDVIDA